MFVTVEGIEGCGKSTLITGLSERFRSEGRATFVTREPGGTPAGDAIRKIFLEPALQMTPLTEAFLINAARAQHVIDGILPALRSGALVLCDRFVDSTLAYQGYGRGLDIAMLRAQCEVATDGLTPDLTIVLDIPVAISRERVALWHTGPDRMESQDDAFHQRARDGFLKLAQSDRRFRVFDGTKSPIELVAQAHRVIEERLAR